MNRTGKFEEVEQMNLWHVYSKTGDSLGTVEAFYFWEVQKAYGHDITAYKICEHCRNDLIPGKNWFTGRGEHVCIVCSPVVVVDSILPKKANNYSDAQCNYWHDKIMARQEASGMYD